jgi:hypothetical protein
MNANVTTTTATVISKGETAGGFAYEIKNHLKGSRNEYFVLKGSKGERFSFLHTSKSLAYLKKILEKY